MLTQGELKWYGEDVKRKLRAIASRAVFEAAAALLQEANKKCPHRTGYLQSTGKADVDRQNLTGWVSYDTPYAVRLHEHPEYNFGEGREGKWLENALERTRDRLLSHISSAIDRGLR